MEIRNRRAHVRMGKHGPVHVRAHQFRHTPSGSRGHHLVVPQPQEYDGTDMPPGMPDDAASAIATFVSLRWDDRQAAFDTLTVDEQDVVADAERTVPERVAHALRPLGERPSSGPVPERTALRCDTAARAGVVMPDAAERVKGGAERLRASLREAGAPDDAAARLEAEFVDALLAQEAETMRRSGGDHGVRHLLGDAELATSILSGRPAGLSPADEAELLVVAAFHDIGYLAPPSRVGMKDSHPRWSGQHYGSSVSETVAECLGQKRAAHAEHVVRTHSDPDIDWDADPVASAFRVADNLALFHDEKLPAFVRYVPANRAALERLARDLAATADKAKKKARKAGEHEKRAVKEWRRAKQDVAVGRAKDEMLANVRSADLPDTVREALSAAVAELGAKTPKKALGMLCGEVAGVSWATDGSLTVRINRNKHAERLSGVLDIGQRQLAKFAKAYGEDPSALTERGRMEIGTKPPPRRLLTAVVVKKGAGREPA